MVEVIDYYSLGLDRAAGWEDLKKQVQKQVEKWRHRANTKGPGGEAAQKRDLWAKALAFFKDESSRKAYDALLEQWQRSPAAKAAKDRAKADAEEFAQKNSAVPD